MIKEDYVSFETAKLLEEKRFDEKISTHYLIHSNGFPEFFHKKDKFPDPEDIWLKCPTQQMVLTWLREKGIAVVPIIYSVLDNESFLWDVKIVIAKTNETYRQGWVYKQYENAIEDALEYVLKNLI